MLTTSVHHKLFKANSLARKYRDILDEEFKNINFEVKQNGLGLFHLILRNRNIKKQEHLWCAVTALNKVIGRQSFRIASALNSEEDNLYHLVCANPLCNKEILMFIKEILRNEFMQVRLPRTLF